MLLFHDTQWKLHGSLQLSRPSYVKVAQFCYLDSEKVVGSDDNSALANSGS